LTLSQKVTKNAIWGKSRPKINLKPVADVAFDLRNDFHAKPMILEKKIFLGNFGLFRRIR
jgi:hypothetical protein